MDILNALHGSISSYLASHSTEQLVLLFYPFVVLMELPYNFIILLGTLSYYRKRTDVKPKRFPYYPTVSCVLVVYKDGPKVLKSLKSIIEQLYRGRIEILVVFDGKEENAAEISLLKGFLNSYKIPPKRKITLIPKTVRGGRVSNFNLALKMAHGDIFLAIDGDSSCDNSAIENVVYEFINKNVVGVSGTLKVRNRNASLLTKFQTLEYIIAIQMNKVGLRELRMVNNISGAFSSYRTDFLRKIGGWASGTAEDLDLTLRTKSFFKKFPNFKLSHTANAIVLTDVPETWKDLFLQRLRWDGDMAFLLYKRHWRRINPGFLGWKNFLGVFIYDIMIHSVFSLLIFFYTFYLLSAYGVVDYLVILFFSYIYYLCLSFIMFMIFIILISERKKQDFVLLPYLFLFPFYQYITKLWVIVSIFLEFIFKNHLSSNMAPYWVMKKSSLDGKKTEGKDEG